MTETHRLLIALFSITLYVLWVAVLFYKNKKMRPVLQADSNKTLVIYASQTGTAEKIARSKAASMAQHEAITLVSMATLNVAMLTNVSKALFVVSTYGEGEPPDAGVRFYRSLQRLTDSGETPLSHLAFEVIGLGSKEYNKFCHFAVCLYEKVILLGGSPIASLTTLDSRAGEHLTHFGSPASDTSEQIETWLLQHRAQLNLDENRRLYGVSLIPSLPATTTNKHAMTWDAGDIFEVYPNKGSGTLGQSEQVGRAYTIASVPTENDIKLIVRQVRKAQNELGLGSGFLTQNLIDGQRVYAQIRKNSNAAVTDTQCPLVLIAAGSGIAGVRAQLAKRAVLNNTGPVWIFYGERDPTLDNILNKALSPFDKSTCIVKTSVIFSRSCADPNASAICYVQHLVKQEASALLSFLGSNGQIYVCGQFDGMGKGVDAVLQDILGEQHYRMLIDKGRYHRDLY